MVNRTAFAAISLAITAVAGSACSPGQNPSSQPGSQPPVQSGPSSAASVSPPSAGNSLVAQLKTPDGRPVATATFDFTNGYVTVTAKTDVTGILAPGLHDMHIHQIGKCEPNSVAPTGGPPGNFLSAGDHYQAPGHTGKPASGDLTMLEVRGDGSAYLVTTTDAFTRDQLLAGEKTAVMLHGAEGSDDAMQRVACGVIEPRS
ncbi:superoxide dismutase[Cu-Zn] [Mycobacterium kubicae]|uniref:superoxide dismutase[Cu-Zn] n=1 Tax=Mycobacterium kubicae TaxID=120959 RepID=UPI0009EE62EB|nr:superoxide dismutase family protein [Mycobacterium kubicae]